MKCQPLQLFRSPITRPLHVYPSFIEQTRYPSIPQPQFQSIPQPHYQSAGKPSYPWQPPHGRKTATIYSDIKDTKHKNRVVLITRPILGLCPANERRRYFVTSLIGWVQALITVRGLELGCVDLSFEAKYIQKNYSLCWLVWRWRAYVMWKCPI